MVKKDLVEEFAMRLDCTKTQARRITDTFLDLIVDGLKEDQKVILSGFGTFMVKTRKARMGINPSTKEKLQLPENKNVLFKVSKNVKQDVSYALGN